MSYTGMNSATGKTLTGIDHIWQSCRDILNTRIGTRIARRNYGSLLPELIDHPGHEANMLRLKAATVMALAQWEPRIEIRNVATYIDTENKGRFEIAMESIRKDGPQAGNTLTLNIPIGGLR